MLNRRFLRVKVLQHLYSLQTVDAAVRDMVINEIKDDLKREVRIKGRADSYDLIEERRKELEEERRKELESTGKVTFSNPKEDNEEEEDSIIIESRQPLDLELNKRIDAAVKLFNDNSSQFGHDEYLENIMNSDIINLENISGNDNYSLEPDFSIENIVKKGVIKYKNSCKESYSSIYFSFIDLPEKIENSYWFFIGLLVRLKSIEKVIPLKDKVFSHKRYTQLKILDLLIQNSKLKDKISKYQSEKFDLTACRMYEKVFNSKNWEDFLEIKDPKKEDEITLLNGIIRDIFYDDVKCIALLDKIDTRWEENKKAVRDIIKQFLKRINFETQHFEMPQLSGTWEEYFEFMKQLFKITFVKSYTYEQIITPYLENWTIERIAKIDLIIIKMALTELLEFQNIPVKVTINEYIDIGKKYSTRESQVFINGILHKISNAFLEEGKIKKTGRGSIDNK